MIIQFLYIYYIIYAKPLQRVVFPTPLGPIIKLP